jgi:nitroreductase
MLSEPSKSGEASGPIRTRRSAGIDVETIIDAGICAPTGHNCQPWHFTVITNKALLDRINKKTSEVMAGAEDDWVHRTGSNPDFPRHIRRRLSSSLSPAGKTPTDYTADCSAAIEKYDLAAESIGIGSVWLGLCTVFLYPGGRDEGAEYSGRL